jgi:shikimate 5-dehydrogenase
MAGNLLNLPRYRGSDQSRYTKVEVINTLMKPDISAHRASVNTVHKGGVSKAYNTDIYGFIHPFT